VTGSLFTVTSKQKTDNGLIFRKFTLVDWTMLSICHKRTSLFLPNLRQTRYQLQHRKRYLIWSRIRLACDCGIRRMIRSGFQRPTYGFCSVTHWLMLHQAIVSKPGNSQKKQYGDIIYASIDQLIPFVDFTLTCSRIPWTSIHMMPKSLDYTTILKISLKECW
jgi:hypothetical protein